MFHVEHLPALTTEELPAPASLIDRADPGSLINLAPGPLGIAIDESVLKRPELFRMVELELYKTLRSEKKTPDPTDNRIRLQFWLEYDNAVAQGRKMKIGNIFSGLVTHEYLHHAYFKRPEKIAWLLCIPTGYDTKCREGLEFGIDQLRQILEEDHHLPSGKIDTKLIEAKIKITAMLDARVKGAVVQKTMNLHAHTSDKQIAKMAAGQTMEALEKRLKTLEIQDRRAQNIPDDEKKPEPTLVDNESINIGS